MEKIFASRGMGKSTTLMNKALTKIRKGYKVVYICPSNSQADFFNNRGFDSSKIVFMPLHRFLDWAKGRNLKDYYILIDELDYCIADILGTTNFTYSLTVGGN